MRVWRPGYRPGMSDRLLLGPVVTGTPSTGRRSSGRGGRHRQRQRTAAEAAAARRQDRGDAGELSGRAGTGFLHDDGRAGVARRPGGDAERDLTEQGWAARLALTVDLPTPPLPDATA